MYFALRRRKDEKLEARRVWKLASAVDAGETEYYKVAPAWRKRKQT